MCPLRYTIRTTSFLEFSKSQGPSESLPGIPGSDSQGPKSPKIRKNSEFGASVTILALPTALAVRCDAGTRQTRTYRRLPQRHASRAVLMEQQPSRRILQLQVHYTQVQWIQRMNWKQLPAWCATFFAIMKYQCLRSKRARQESRSIVKKQWLDSTPTKRTTSGEGLFVDVR